MAKYIKTAVTEAEQFDGSQQLVDKYEILVGSTMFNGYVGEPSLCYIQTLEGNLRIHVGDWIATGISGEHWVIADDVFNKTYVELPVIPKSWAGAIEEYRDRFGSAKGLNELITDMNVPWKLGVLETVTAIPEIILGVFRSKTDVLARAWLDGYEIDNKS